MPFELSLFGPGEHSLFYRLPPGDRSMGYGVVGHLRGEVDFSGYYDTWLPQASHLTTPALRQEIKDLRETLRLEIFAGGTAGLEYCRKAQAIDSRDTGFKICTEDYSYYFCCQPAGCFHYNLTMYAYDNSFLLPELAGAHEIPDQCYAVDHGRLMRLRRYIEPEHVFTGDTPDANQRLADEWNMQLGVTKAQVVAMQMGLEYGFKDPRAWPWQYDLDGKPREYVKHKPREREGM